MSNFTPGPWHVGDEHGAEQLRPSIRILRDVTYVEGARPTTYVIASVTYPTTVGNTVGTEERRGNARLIAAAPDLLVACQTFAEWLRREEAGGTNQPWAGKRDTLEGEAAWRKWYYENLRICDLAQKQVRAAIAKATGEAP